MKKRYLKVVLVVAMMFLITGCSKNEEVSINPEKLSEDLLNGVKFEDELSEIDEGSIKNLYDIDEFKDGKVYISSGATSEEIAILEFDSKEEASKGKEAFLNRIEDQKEAYESYAPEEIKKLDNAVVKQKDNYIILVISDGNEAGKIVGK